MKMNSPLEILVVDDDRKIVNLIGLYLKREGFDVSVAYDGQEAVNRAIQKQPALIILDLMLPKMNGMEVCQILRTKMRVPIIMLTARTTEEDKIGGLDIGADDYVTKPFSPGELGARIKAVLRRAEMSSVTDGMLTIDEHLSVDFDEREVIVDGERVPLRPTEYRLLYQLIQNAGRTLPYETLLARVWGHEYRDEIHYVHLYVTYLRQKIEPDPQNPKYILTKRGVGYSFRPLEQRRQG